MKSNTVQKCESSLIQGLIKPPRSQRNKEWFECKEEIKANNRSATRTKHNLFYALNELSTTPLLMQFGKQRHRAR